MENSFCGWGIHTDTKHLLKKGCGGPKTSMERNGMDWVKGLLRTKCSVAKTALGTVIFAEENGIHRVCARVSKSNTSNS